MRWRVFLPCAAGVEALLCDEVARLLPGCVAQSRRGGVSLSCDDAGLMTLNLGSRLAQRVLIELASAEYRHEDDLYALARQRLASLGIARVHGGGDCTHTDARRWYSHRRDGVTGRMASLVWIAPP